MGDSEFTKGLLASVPLALKDGDVRILSKKFLREVFLTPEIFGCNRISLMAQEIVINFEAHRRSNKLDRTDLMDAFDISAPTLEGYLQDTTKVLDRRVLEQAMELFGCGLDALLTTRVSPFFDCFSEDQQAADPCETASVNVIRRSDAHLMQRGGYRISGLRDNVAADRVFKLLDIGFKKLSVSQVSAETREEFKDLLEDNCVVFGSPMANRATELALAEAFGIVPFEASEQERMPFLFHSSRAEGYGASSVMRLPEGTKRGIAVAKGELVLADYWPPEEFYDLTGVEGRDCAAIVVVNRKNKGGQCKKLIILAGFSGVGTEAAAAALYAHYRDLEPRGEQRVVWAVVRATYAKKKRGMSRDYDGSFQWYCRIGGRRPIRL